jgi:hypothetical protein
MKKNLLKQNTETRLQFELNKTNHVFNQSQSKLSPKNKEQYINKG